MASRDLPPQKFRRNSDLKSVSARKGLDFDLVDCILSLSVSVRREREWKYICATVGTQSIASIV